MKKIIPLATAFAVIFGVMTILVYIVVTVGPVYAIACGLVVSACVSGNTWLLLASQWILPGFIALLTSPLMVDYYETKKELKRLKEYLEDMEAEEMDADR